MRGYAAPAGAGLAAFALAARILWPGDAAGPALGFLLDAAALVAGGLAVLATDRVRLPRTVILLAALGGWALLSRSWAGESLPAWATGTSWIAAGALAAAAGQPRAGTLHALAAAAASQAAFSLWQLAVGLPTLRDYLKAHPDAVEFQGREREEFLTRLYTDEPFGTFPTSNVLCAFLAIALPVLVGRLFDARGWKPRALLALPVAAAAVAALLTRSLGGFVALAAAGAVFAWRARWPDPGATRRRVGIAAIAAALVVGAALLVLHPGRFDWTQPRSSLGYRAGYARGSLAIVREAPVLGVGASNWDTHYTRHMSPTAGEAQRAHCDPLQVWAELGLLGLALFAALPVALLLRASPVTPEPPGPFPLPAAVGVGTAFLAQGWIEGRFAETGPLVAAAQLALAACALAGSALAPYGRYTAAGVLAGAAAFFTHGLVEYDLYVPGVLFSAAALFACAPRTTREFPSLALTAAASAVAAAALYYAGTLPSADVAVQEALRRPADGPAVRAALDGALTPEGPWRLSGAVHSVRGHAPGDCLAAIDRALALSPNSAGLRFNRARLQWDHGDREGALGDFREAARLYPNLAQHRFWLGRALRALSMEGWREEYERSLALSASADVPRRSLDPGEQREAEEALGR